MSATANYRELLNEIEAKARGLFFAGHYRDGVSLGDSIVSGCNIAERVGNIFSTMTRCTDSEKI